MKSHEKGLWLVERLAIAHAFALLFVLTVVCGCAKDRTFADPRLASAAPSNRQVIYAQHLASDEVDLPTAPRSLEHPSKDDFVNLSLADAVRLALENSEFIRVRDEFLSRDNGLLRNPASQPSVSNPAIQATNVLYNNRGIEAALADFDPILKTSALWGHKSELQNGPLPIGSGPRATLTNETALFATRLSKTFGDGGELAVGQDMFFSEQNAFPNLGQFPSGSSGLMALEYRRPLGAASGRTFTEVAGPASIQARGLTGVSQGIAIARINNDIARDDFEVAVHRLLKDVEDLYWELFQAYCRYDGELKARRFARMILKREEELGGIRMEDNPDYLEAYETDLEYQSRVIDALANIYEVERRLRRMLGKPTSDGILLRPIEPPAKAQLVVDWHSSMSGALVRRVELHRQESRIHSLRLQLAAARNAGWPQLDFVSRGRISEFGDGAQTGLGFGTPYDQSFYGTQTGVVVGLESTWPIGLRTARAQIRNLSLELARAQSGLQNQEREIGHEMAYAVQSLERHYLSMRSNLQQLKAARRRTRLLDKYREHGKVPVKTLLIAQLDAMKVEQAYFESLTRYNQAIADLHFRDGSILNLNSVQIIEDDCGCQAYSYCPSEVAEDVQAVEAVEPSLLHQPTGNEWMGVEDNDLLLPQARREFDRDPGPDSPELLPVPRANRKTLEP